MSNPTAQKREKEKQRQDRAKDKDAKRVQRQKDRPDRGPSADGVDPDIAFIVPGPQPIPED